MAVINEGNARLALLMEQHPEYPVIFEASRDLEEGERQVIEDADVDVAILWHDVWYFDVEEFGDAYCDRHDEYDRTDDDWFQDYFNRHAQEVIHVILNDEEEETGYVNY